VKAGSVASRRKSSAKRARFLQGQPLTATFDPRQLLHRNKFHKALLIDQLQTDPVSGHFPSASAHDAAQGMLNHLGKMAFNMYWHALLPGYDIPGVPTHGSLRKGP
jgi:hypothetical protein